MATRPVTLQAAQERFREPQPRERRERGVEGARSPKEGAREEPLDYSPLPPHEEDLYRIAPLEGRGGLARRSARN